ncbi:MAG: histidinol-phosphate aminotransferase [Proteobacteria bacterium]|nr:histidinol-phosphate aminotransferase [Pseudomonadota bacterium]
MAFDALKLAVPGVRGLQPYVPGKPIEELEREYGVTNVIKLASNENPLGPSPKALAAAQVALPEIARYPDGGGFALKRALAAKLSVLPEQITLGNGSNDILEFAARAFVTAQDEVIFSQHAFAVYPIVTRAVDAHAVEVPARDWGHDLTAMHAAITARTRLIFIANPNNPTGTWLRRAALEEFLDMVPANVIVVVDEAYFEYVEESDYPDTIAWLARYPNLICARTFSKIYGLAGLRVGYGVSSPAIADILNRVRQPFNVNSIAQAAALAALDDDVHLDKARRVNADGMRQLVQGFEQLGLDYIPSAGNFVCVEVGEAGRVYEQLLRAGVIVRPVANYGMPRHLRVTVGLANENQRFLDALKAALGR